ARGPGIPANRSAGGLLELLDLGRTACAFAGVESHRLDQGVDQSPVLCGRADSVREDVFAEMGSDKMLFDGRYKLMYGDSRRDRRTEYFRYPYHGPQFGRPVNLPPDRLSLFDLASDPHETHNLAEDASHRDLVEGMKSKLLNRMIRNSQAAPEDPGSVR
ncbi:MAG: hypothetical protein HC888_13050, partial [Candidatus Competibacteraceae bacterium]|nr:hypothetical protein [Candidatus Competibacteraceae bacterium]